MLSPRSSEWQKSRSVLSFTHRHPFLQQDVMGDGQEVTFSPLSVASAWQEDSGTCGVRNISFLHGAPRYQTPDFQRHAESNYRAIKKPSRTCQHLSIGEQLERESWEEGAQGRQQVGDQAEAGGWHPKCLLHSADIWKEHPGSQALGIGDQDKHDLANSETAEGQDVPLRPIRRIAAAQSHAQRLAQSHRVCRCNQRLLLIPPSIPSSPPCTSVQTSFRHNGSR